MNGYLLYILPLLTLPNMVMAITCYTCTPNPPTLACTTAGDLNVTDCDADPNIPSGMANVCTKVLAVVKMGQMGQLNANMFGCGMKAMCQDSQAKGCNASRLPSGMTYEKCEATCCDQNKCNGLGDSTSATPSSPATSVSAQPTNVSATGTPPKPASGATAYNKVVSFATILTSALCFVY
ncbi:uncharacterized protein LOC111337898 isoform X1 [Stylophora pistillata]|uniref:uncharacterized protein LOC111337898 isoform X1 n=1 Tax=Stylophora pistillata TaxID=50429 RepID=UPI000C04BEA9|nr:uncharacterized protein LOC111337898 isoform X1 [Stylophora pistillata]